MLMEELSPQEGHKPRHMSEETKKVIVKIEAFKLVDFTNKFDATYVIATCQLDILTVSVVVFVQVPAKKFKNKSFSMSFRLWTS